MQVVRSNNLKFKDLKLGETFFVHQDSQIHLHNTLFLKIPAYNQWNCFDLENCRFLQLEQTYSVQKVNAKIVIE